MPERMPVEGLQRLVATLFLPAQFETDFMERLISAVAAAIAVIIVLMFVLNKSFAQAQARFSFTGIANCHQPPISNYPIHGEGTGRLSADGSAALDVDSNVEGRQRYDVKLGERQSKRRAVRQRCASPAAAS